MAKLKKKELKNVTVSNNTLRDADLIFSFGSLLMHYDDTKRMMKKNSPFMYGVFSLDTPEDIKIMLERLCEYYPNENNESMYLMQYELEWLYDTLDSIAPKGYYFGSHQGNGSDMGFWECNDSV